LLPPRGSRQISGGRPGNGKQKKCSRLIAVYKTRGDVQNNVRSFHLFIIFCESQLWSIEVMPKEE
jgi:hypothetical protein